MVKGVYYAEFEECGEGGDGAMEKREVGMEFRSKRSTRLTTQSRLTSDGHDERNALVTTAGAIALPPKITP